MKNILFMGQAQSDPEVSEIPTNAAQADSEGGTGGKRKHSVAQRFMGLSTLLSSVTGKKTSSQDTSSGNGSIRNGRCENLSTCQPAGLFETTLTYRSLTPLLSADMDLDGSMMINGSWRPESEYSLNSQLNLCHDSDSWDTISTITMSSINSVDSYRSEKTPLAFFMQLPQHRDLSGMHWLNTNILLPTLSPKKDLTKGFKETVNNIDYADDEVDSMNSYIEEVADAIHEANMLLAEMDEDEMLNNSK